MAERHARLGLWIDPGDGVDADALAELAWELRRELLELDVLGVGPAGVGEAPAGSKGVDLVAVGGLVVGLAGSGGLLGEVVGTVQAWAARRGPRSVRLELDGDALEVAGVSSREQRALIQVWIDRHGGL